MIAYPSLRNVAMTAPHGQNDAFPTLEGIICHHLNPSDSLRKWQRNMAKLPSVPWLETLDFLVWDDRMEMNRYRKKIDIKSKSLSDEEITDLVAFMHALTGKSVTDFRFEIPEVRSLQSAWEASPWISGGERFSFEYFGKIKRFGRKLNQKDSQLLFNLLSNKIKKFRKK